MNDETFALIWVLSFFLYLVIYTYWIPLKTQKRIETWLLSQESDKTLLEALEVIVKEIRKTTLTDFEEFMLPRAKEAAQKFWSGAMGNAAQSLGKTEEGSKLQMLSDMAKDLSGQPWYVQAAASKLMPLMEKAANPQKDGTRTESSGMGIRK